MSKLPLRERANPGLHDFVFSWLMKQSPAPQSTESVLDIGCGSGAWLQRFALANFQNLVGLDLDVQQFGLSLPKYQVDIDTYVDHQWGQFDWITALEIIEHLSNPGHLFVLAASNLKPNGHLLISTPNIHGLPARLRYLVKGRLNHFDNKSDPTHIYPVYHENIQRLANRYGFTIVDHHHFPERGYGTYRPALRLASRMLSFAFPDSLPGDNLLYLLKKQPS